MLQVVCVLKSGGAYNWEYVERLYKQVKGHLTFGFKFMVLTDMWNRKELPPEGIQVLYLQSDFKSYWAKLELFRLEGEVLYFDLDTIILGDLDTLVEGIRTITSFSKTPDNFFMMKAFSRHRKYASGIMAWTGDFSYLYNSTKPEMIERYGKWEQDYVVDRLHSMNYKINFIDDCIGGGIVSYKHHCLKGIPESAEIICFHGEPRPREVNWLEEELLERK